MENFIAGFMLALIVSPFLWPAFMMIYRYFREVEDRRYERKQGPTS
jgi:hypothetical protein